MWETRKLETTVCHAADTVAVAPQPTPPATAQQEFSILSSKEHTCSRGREEEDRGEQHIMSWDDTTAVVCTLGRSAIGEECQ